MGSALTIIVLALFIYSVINVFKLIKTRDKTYLKKALALFVSCFIITLLIPDSPTEGGEYPVAVSSSEENKNKEEVEAEPKTELVVESSTNSASPAVNEITKQSLYKVIRVVDGDTIEVDINGKSEKVRLIGIDTPESVHPDENKNVPYGKIASEFTKSKLEGQSIALEFDAEERDRYGRLLAYVWLDNVMFNKTLLSEGMAQVATFPPNVKYVDDFLALERQAKGGSVGLWNDATLNPDKIPAQTTVSENTNTQTQSSQVNNEISYIGNRNTKKFHYPSCSSVDQMNESNKVGLVSRNDAINNGFVPCKRCNP